MVPKITVKRKLPRVSGAYDIWVSLPVRERAKGSLFIVQPQWRLIPLGICADMDAAIRMAIASLPCDEKGLSQWEYLNDGVIVWQAKSIYARITARILD